MNAARWCRLLLLITCPAPAAAQDTVPRLGAAADEDAPPALETTAPTSEMPPARQRDPRLGIVPAKLQLGMAVNAVLDICPDMVEVSRRGPKRVFAALSCVQVQSDIPTAARLTFRNDRLTLYSVSAQFEYAVSAVAHFVNARGGLRAVHGDAACARREERVCLDGNAEQQVDCLLGTSMRSGRLVNERIVMCSARHDRGTAALSISVAVNPAGPLPWMLTAAYGTAGAR